MVRKRDSHGSRSANSHPLDPLAPHPLDLSTRSLHIRWIRSLRLHEDLGLRLEGQLHGQAQQHGRAQNRRGHVPRAGARASLARVRAFFGSGPVSFRSFSFRCVCVCVVFCFSQGERDAKRPGIELKGDLKSKVCKPGVGGRFGHFEVGVLFGP